CRWGVAWDDLAIRLIHDVKDRGRSRSLRIGTMREHVKRGSPFPRPLWVVGGGVARRQAQMTSATSQSSGALPRGNPARRAPADEGRGNGIFSERRRTDATQRGRRVAMWSVALLIAAAPAAARADDGQRLSVIEENDSIFFDSDDHYTQGLRF